MSSIGRVYNLPLFNPERRLPKATHLQLLSHEVTRALLPATFAMTIPFPAYEQGAIGSCTANALLAAFRLQAPNPQWDPSRLFLYYATRERGHRIGLEGAYLDDGYAVLQQQGVCAEKTWPYITQQVDVKPPGNAYAEAKQFHISGWGVVDKTNLINNVKQVLVGGRPVVFGMLIYSGFESLTVEQTGIVSVPDTAKETLLGGHALCMVGYDDTKKAFLVLNSWGTNWGTAHPSAPDNKSRGFCYVPYDYIANPNLCDECLFNNSVVFESPPVPPPPPPPVPKPVPIPPPRPPAPKPKPRPPPPKPKPKPRSKSTPGRPIQRNQKPLRPRRRR